MKIEEMKREIYNYYESLSQQFEATLDMVEKQTNGCDDPGVKINIENQRTSYKV